MGCQDRLVSLPSLPGFHIALKVVKAGGLTPLYGLVSLLKYAAPSSSSRLFFLRNMERNNISIRLFRVFILLYLWSSWLCVQMIHR